MLEHWLLELAGHASGLSDAQLNQIEKSLPPARRCSIFSVERDRSSNRRKTCTWKPSR
jgi:hypothetical protein